MFPTNHAIKKWGKLRQRTYTQQKQAVDLYLGDLRSLPKILENVVLAANLLLKKVASGKSYHHVPGTYFKQGSVPKYAQQTQAVNFHLGEFDSLPKILIEA